MYYVKDGNDRLLFTTSCKKTAYRITQAYCRSGRTADTDGERERLLGTYCVDNFGTRMFVKTEKKKAGETPILDTKRMDWLDSIKYGDIVMCNEIKSIHCTIRIPVKVTGKYADGIIKLSNGIYVEACTGVCDNFYISRTKSKHYVSTNHD